MKKKLSLALGKKSSALWMMAGNCTYALSQALLIALFSKHLGPEAVGVFSYSLAITAPIIVLTNFGLRSQITTDAKNEISLHSACRFRNISGVIGLLVCIICIAIVKGDWNIIAPVSIIAMSKIFESKADLHYGILSKNHLQKKIAISIITRSILGIAAVITAILFTNNLNIILLSYAAGWLSAVLAIDHRSTRYYVQAQGAMPTTGISKFFIAGLPLGISTFLINISANFPKITLEHYEGLSNLGVYSALYFIVQSGSILINSIGQAALPRLSEYFNKGDYVRHRQLFVKSALFASCMSVLGFTITFMFGEQLISIFFGDEVSKQSDLLWLMFLASPLQYICTLYGYTITSTKKNYNLLIVQLLNCAVSAAASFYAVSTYGVYGAVAAVPLTSLAVLIAYTFIYVSAIKPTSSEAKQKKTVE